MLRRHALVVTLALAILAAPLASHAQHQPKVPRIGFLRVGSPPDPMLEVFRQRLRELGYVEGQNIAFEYQWAEGRLERLPDLAAELVRLKVDVIVAGGNHVVLAARRATSTIPIVMPVSSDPVGAGLVASLARPGGNVTGFTSLGDELSGKRLELLKEALPRITRVAVLWDPTSDAGQLKASEAAARALGMQFQTLEVRDQKDYDSAFMTAQKGRAGALVVLGSPLFFAHRGRLVDLAAKHRLPVMYHHSGFVTETGGLMSYATNFADLFKRAATYVDKVLKGAKPADLPVEQPTTFELAINLKTAKALGLTIPRSILIRADQVVQ